MKRVRATQQSDLGRVQSPRTPTSLSIPHRAPSTSSTTNNNSSDNSNKNNNTTATTNTQTSARTTGGAIRRRDTATRARKIGPPGSSSTNTSGATTNGGPAGRTRLFGNVPVAGRSKKKTEEATDSTPLDVSSASSSAPLPQPTSTYSLRGSTRKNTAETNANTTDNASSKTGGSSSSGGQNTYASARTNPTSNTSNSNAISSNSNTNSTSSTNNTNTNGVSGGNGSGSGVNDSENVPLVPSTPQAKKTRSLPFATFELPSSPMDVYSGNSTTMRSPGLKSPSKKRVYDRFIPVREADLSEQYSLLPDAPSTPSRQRMQNLSMTPSQVSQMADNYKKAQDQSHGAIMANELNLMPHMQSPSENRMLTSPQRYLTSPQRRLFNYSSTTTYNTMHFDSPSRQIYSNTPVSYESRKILLSPKKATRTVGASPFKVLDAPDLKDDFYLNLVDWSSQNVLGVGLGSCVYLWHALNGKVTQLCDLGENDSVASLSWISMGTHLAVGTDSGAVQIWDVATSCRVRSMTGHQQRVGVLAWSGHTLTSGSRDRNIYHRDVRAQSMWTHKLEAHTGEVCGLKWNVSGTQLASGGNDNRLMVWEKGATKPLYKFRDHTAAVKAIDWNPHSSGVLASGGGTVDRHIRFWNTNTGQAIGAYDTGSQVCNLVWSKTTNELVSTHGYSQNQVFVWKYPSMEQIAVLKGHTYRVLYLSLSPDGQTIVTGAGDETLRFWNVFQKSKIERRDDDDLDGIAGVTTIR
ncbi:substrate-specific activator of APC-dependent proteolysis [Podila verticillata]|nr:substrate-specific activator of APC-dependent proteolysis [Podila verticillata]